MLHRLQQEGRAHAVPRGGEDHCGGDQEQRADCDGGEVSRGAELVWSYLNIMTSPQTVAGPAGAWWTRCTA